MSAVTEARDTQSGSIPSASRVPRRSRSSISSTAGSSGEEGRLVRWAGWWDRGGLSPCALALGKLTAKFKVYLVASAKSIIIYLDLSLILVISGFAF